MQPNAKIQSVLGLGALVIMVLWAVGSSAELASYTGAVSVGPDPVERHRNPYYNVFGPRAKWDGEFTHWYHEHISQIRDQLPRGEVGYITDAQDLEAATRYNLAMTALAPVLIERGEDHRYVIADFKSDAALKREYETGKWLEPKVFYSPGLTVFERKVAP